MKVSLKGIISRSQKKGLRSIHRIDGSVKRFDQDLFWAWRWLLKLSRDFIGSARLGDGETFHIVEVA
jgi:hypothetical protein